MPNLKLPTSTTGGEGDTSTVVLDVIDCNDAEPEVSSLTIKLSEMKTTYAFDTPRALREVFRVDVAREILSCLDGMNPDERILSLPDLAIRAQGVVLSGLTMLVTVGKDDQRQLQLRFHHCLGDIQDVLVLKREFTLQTPTLREKIAVDVLRDIVNPVFDLLSLNGSHMSHLVDVNAEAIHRRLRLIESRREELSFYVGLLQRYVTGCQKDSGKLPKDAPNGSVPTEAGVLSEKEAV